jgi:GNAT superfamily N-acetyltransferase
MAEVVIEQHGLEAVDADMLAGLESLYARAYHDSKMYADLREDIALQPDIFQLFVARADGDIVGARVIETKAHGFIDYHGHVPVHGKRFSVSPEYRGQGIGAAIIEAGNNYCFNDLDLKAVFGESNEIGALSLYGRQGALYALGSIEKALRRNTPAAARRLFTKFITDPELRELRLPGSIPGGHDAVQFVYCRDKTTEDEFRGYDFASYQELVGTHTEVGLRTHGR